LVESKRDWEEDWVDDQQEIEYQACSCQGVEGNRGLQREDKGDCLSKQGKAL